ncbi:MAG: hydroxysqualene dehydroxylase HpnE [Pseudomonadota bacterium]
MNGIVHIVGAGLAGLSAATRLAEMGHRVHVYEANPVAGGRVRTWHDKRLGRDIDNGNHLLLSGNRSAQRYLDRIDAKDRMETATEAAFAFADLETGERWRVRMNAGPLPWWVLVPPRRIPGTSLADYAQGIALMRAKRGQTVAEVIPARGRIWKRFWEPLTLAVLNTTPEDGEACLLWAAMAETFARGGHLCRPMFAPAGLGTALVDPAEAHLRRHGARIHFRHALKAVPIAAGRASALQFADDTRVEIFPQDRVILALPPTRLGAVLPGLELPRDDAGILNAHFVVEDPAITDGLAPITGLVHATTHWAFVRGDVISLTVSAADRLGLMEEDPEALAPRLWVETCAALNLGAARYRAARINKERRATFDQSPKEAAKRPAARTALTNLFLAGDATQTGLPATIEGAIRSGETAARLAA